MECVKHIASQTVQSELLTGRVPFQKRLRSWRQAQILSTDSFSIIQSWVWTSAQSAVWIRGHQRTAFSQKGTTALRNEMEGLESKKRFRSSALWPSAVLSMLGDWPGRRGQPSEVIEWVDIVCVQETKREQFSDKELNWWQKAFQVVLQASQWQ